MIFDVPDYLKSNKFLFQLNYERELKEHHNYLYTSFYDFNIICLHNKNNIFENIFFETFSFNKEKLIFRFEKLLGGKVRLETMIYLAPNNKASIFFNKKIVLFFKRNGILYTTNYNVKRKNRKSIEAIDGVTYFYFSVK